MRPCPARQSLCSENVLTWSSSYCAPPPTITPPYCGLYSAGKREAPMSIKPPPLWFILCWKAVGLHKYATPRRGIYSAGRREVSMSMSTPPVVYTILGGLHEYANPPLWFILCWKAGGSHEYANLPHHCGFIFCWKAGGPHEYSTPPPPHCGLYSSGRQETPMSMQPPTVVYSLLEGRRPP